MSQWLEWRRRGIGGSDAAIVLRKFPFGKTPKQLYDEKVYGISMQEDNPAMAHGKNYEDRALNLFEDKTGCLLWRQLARENAERPWVRATLDGLDINGEFLVEVKCPYNLGNHELVKSTKKVPEIYYPQCQHQMLVTDLPSMYFLSYNWTNETDSIILEVQRDEPFIENMIKEYEIFWECVKKKTPPPLTELDFREKENDEWRVAAAKWREATAHLKSAEKEEEKWRRILIDDAADQNCQGEGVRVRRVECDGRIDYSKIMADYPQVPWENYRKDSSVQWRIKDMGLKMIADI